jgi:GNAT superfamily N-acetyltransferase
MNASVLISRAMFHEDAPGHPPVGSATVQIREVRPEEYDRVGDLTFDAYAALGEVEYLRWYGEHLRDVAGRVHDATVLVAVDDDGTILGNVTYVDGPESSSADFTDRDAAGMRMLAVDTRAQGRGAGRALIADVIARARAARKQRVLLHTTTFMPIARTLYESLGFVRDESLDIDVPGDQTILGYRLELGQ